MLINSIQILIRIIEQLPHCRSSGIVFWDSTQILARRYIHGCRISPRVNSIYIPNLTPIDLIQDNRSYRFFNCIDNLHLGEIIYQRGNQMLWNFMCNILLSNLTDQPVQMRKGTCCVQLAESTALLLVVSVDLLRLKKNPDMAKIVFLGKFCVKLSTIAFRLIPIRIAKKLQRKQYTLVTHSIIHN